MSDVLLPPLPDYVRLAAALGPIAANQLCVTKWKDGIDIEVPCGDVDQMFRARDLEVARVVLKAAVQACGHLAQSDAVASIIHSLKVKHG